LNVELIKIAEEKNLPLVITNDAHYIEKGGAEVQTLQMLNDQDKTFEDLKNDTEGKIWTIKSTSLYYKSVEELKESFEKYYKNDVFTEEKFWDGIKGAIEVVRKVENYEIDKKNKLPKLYNDSVRALAKKVSDGMKFRGVENKKAYQERAKFEFEILVQKGFVDYFLILDDIVHWTKDRFGRFAVGPGRGCFVPDSRVKMFDGTFKNISDVEIEDELKSGWGNKKKVRNTFAYDVEEELCNIHLSNDDNIKCTQDHKILVIRKGIERKIENAVWIKASEIEKGDALIKNI
jgi:hypothetical protein